MSVWIDLTDVSTVIQIEEESSGLCGHYNFQIAFLISENINTKTEYAI